MSNENIQNAEALAAKSCQWAVSSVICNMTNEFCIFYFIPTTSSEPNEPNETNESNGRHSAHQTYALNHNNKCFRSQNLTYHAWHRTSSIDRPAESDNFDVPLNTIELRSFHSNISILLRLLTLWYMRYEQ